MTDTQQLLEEIKVLQTKLSKAEGALNLALSHLGYADVDHDSYMRTEYGCTVYGDDYVSCHCEDCEGYVLDKYGSYIIEGQGNSESARCDNDDCCYFDGGSEENQ